MRPNILSPCETQSDHYVSDEELHLDGYHEIIRRDRNRNGGGVALYLYKSIPFTDRNYLLCYRHRRHVWINRKRHQGSGNIH